MPHPAAPCGAANARSSPGNNGCGAYNAAKITTPEATRAQRIPLL